MIDPDSIQTGFFVGAVLFGALVARYLAKLSARVPSIEGFTVRASEREKREGEYVTRMVVRGSSKISLCGETFGIRLAKAFAGRDFDVAVGDPEFDGKVHLRGAEDLVVASLTASARESILALVAMGGEVKTNGEVYLEQPGRLRNTSLLRDLLAIMVAVAKALEAVGEEGIVAALAANAANDPEPGVRLRNLELLFSAHRDSPAAQSAAAAGLDDPDARVRLCAAIFAKDPRALRALVVDASADAAVRAEALRNLHDRDPETLALALDSGEEELQSVAMHSVATGRESALLERVLRLAPAAGDGLAEAIGKALGVFDDPRVQLALMRMLNRAAPAVRRAAAWSLGQVGTVAAVELLLPVMERDEDQEVKDAARLAIRRIQGRLGPVEEGRLSVIEAGNEGGLSVAPSDGGLSLPADARKKTQRD